MRKTFVVAAIVLALSAALSGATDARASSTRAADGWGVVAVHTGSWGYRELVLGKGTTRAIANAPVSDVIAHTAGQYTVDSVRRAMAQWGISWWPYPHFWIKVGTPEVFADVVFWACARYSVWWLSPVCGWLNNVARWLAARAPGGVWLEYYLGGYTRYGVW
jgi:hypothetical protein